MGGPSAVCRSNVVSIEVRMVTATEAYEVGLRHISPSALVLGVSVELPFMTDGVRRQSLAMIPCCMMELGGR